MTVTCQRTEILAWCTNFWTIQKDIGTEGNVSYQMSFNERKNLEENFIPKTQSLPSPPLLFLLLPGRFNWEMTTLFYFFIIIILIIELFAVDELLPKLSDFFAVSHFEKLGTDRTAVENTEFSWNGRLNFAFLWRQERSRTNEKWMLGENWRVSQKFGDENKNHCSLSVWCTFFIPLFFSCSKKKKKKWSSNSYFSFWKAFPSAKKIELSEIGDCTFFPRFIMYN